MMRKELKSLQNIRLRANMLEEETSHLRSQLSITQDQLNKRLLEGEEKIAIQTKDVVCSLVYT